MDHQALSLIKYSEGAGDRADESVLSPQEELVKDNIMVVKMRQAKQIDLCDRGSWLIKQKPNQVNFAHLKTD